LPQDLDLRGSLVHQVVPHMTPILNLVAAELGVSIVPASMMQVRVTGIAYRQIAGQSPTTRLALAYRRGETSPVVRNFVANGRVQELQLI
jgi:DNA-binding transcriptional LysR family regulator